MTNPENQEQTTEIVTPPTRYREQTTEIVTCSPQNEKKERPDSTRLILPEETITKKNPYTGTSKTRDIAREMGTRMGLQNAGGSVELSVVMVKDGKKYLIPGNGSLPECKIRYSLSAHEGRLYATPEDPKRNPVTIGQFVETELGLSFKNMGTVIIDVEGTSNKSFDPTAVPQGRSKNTESGWLEKLAEEGDKDDPNKKTSTRKTKKGLSARFDTSS